MEEFRIIVTDDRYESYTEENRVFSELGASVEVHNLDNSETSMEILKKADAVLVNLFPMTREVIGSLDRCKVISRYGVGYDNVDVTAATEMGIWVTNVPDYSMEDVSDHTFALLFDCVRKITYRDRMIRKGKWNTHKNWPSYRTAGKTLGIIGFGAIGKTLLRKISSLGLGRILVHDPFVKPEAVKKAGGIPVSFNELLEKSDYISLHVPLTEKTTGLIGEKEFKRMKTNCIFINTSRGPVVDEDALFRALESGSIAAAGIDVYRKEPLPPESPLRTLDNIILTDHAGWYSEESIVELKTKAALNVLTVLKGGKPAYPLNSAKTR